MVSPYHKMSAKFETCRTQPKSNEPQLTSFTGVGDVSCRFSESPASRDDCAKILIDLNEETARYCLLVSALGTTIDCDLLRQQLRYCRQRVWDHAKNAQTKIIPLIKRRQVTHESTDEYERMYHVLSACLEFLEHQYYITLMVQSEFRLHTDQTILINTGYNESFIPKKGPDKSWERQRSIDLQSLQSVRSGELRNSETDDLRCLKKQMQDLHELVYNMNQAIAIQSWEVIPDPNTDKFTVGVDMNDSTRDSLTNMGSTISEEGDGNRLRCVSIIIITVVIVIIGCIVGILLGLLD